MLVLGAGFGLGWRAVERHQALLTNAEDLGFTDQVIWNFLRGQFFRFSTYQDAEFTTVDQMLEGLERTSARLAETFNTPPLDVASLRAEWRAIRREAKLLPAASLPSRETISDLWQRMKTESARQERSVFETSSVMALSAVRAGVAHGGHIFTRALFDHYRETLAEIQRTDDQISEGVFG